MGTIPKPFWTQVNKTPDCWLWTGCTKGTRTKYGSAWFEGRSNLAHRVAWVLTYGPIPLVVGADSRGTCVRHTCDNPLCVRPDHLVLGTHLDNMKDKVDRRRTTREKKFCKRGHPRTEVNLYKSRQGFWQCRACRRKERRTF